MDALFEMELQEALETSETQEKFKIDNLEAANWALRKLAAINAEEKKINDLKDKEISRIENWAKDELDKLSDSRQFFEGLLTEYFIKQRELEPKFKISTPYGKVTARKQQPKWNYDDEKLVNWLLENDKELVRVKYEPDKNGIKKKYKIVGENVVTEDGEIVEGITVEERQEKINIKVVE